MRISVTFDTLEEMFTFARDIAKGPEGFMALAPAVNVKPDKKAAKDAPEPAKKKAATKEAPAGDDLPFPMNEDAPKEDAGDEIDINDLKSEAKKILAKANAVKNNMVSREWTEELAGKGSKFVNITDPDILKALIQKAKDYIDEANKEGK